MNAVPQSSQHWLILTAFSCVVKLCRYPALHPHHALRTIFWLALCTRMERRIHVVSPGIQNYEPLGAASRHKVPVGTVQTGGLRGREGWQCAMVSGVWALICFPHCLAGTGSLSQPVSSWVGTELGSSPAVGTAAASPSPSGSSPSTALPDPLGQPQASSHASRTQTGAEQSMLHPRGVTGNSTSPLLTASPPTDSAFRGELCWPLLHSFKKPFYSVCFLEAEEMLCFACALFFIIWMVS